MLAHPKASRHLGELVQFSFIAVVDSFRCSRVAAGNQIRWQGRRIESYSIVRVWPILACVFAAVSIMITTATTDSSYLVLLLFAVAA